ncbi:hypothetical protein G5V59_00830 [Nocardioides sp. W3-2-3]|nr:hypothetical protein [Nocardioides convexus]
MRATPAWGALVVSLPRRVGTDRSAGGHPAVRPHDHRAGLATRRRPGAAPLPGGPADRRAGRWLAATTCQRRRADGGRDGRRGRVLPRHGAVGQDQPRRVRREPAARARRPRLRARPGAGQRRDPGLDRRRGARAGQRPGRGRADGRHAGRHLGADHHRPAQAVRRSGRRSQPRPARAWASSRSTRSSSARPRRPSPPACWPSSSSPGRRPAAWIPRRCCAPAAEFPDLVR